MEMEFRHTDDPKCVEIHDETGKVGELCYADPDEEDPTEGWIVSFDDFNGIGRQTDFLPTAAEAVAAAQPLYEDLVADRRRVEKFHRDQPTRFISTPMGGQPKQ